jgi:hypothetical protein
MIMTLMLLQERKGLLHKLIKHNAAAKRCIPIAAAALLLSIKFS